MYADTYPEALLIGVYLECFESKSNRSRMARFILKICGRN